MGYIHIDNLYKAREILAFKKCYALEKIHGTSSHISWNGEKVKFCAGAAPHSEFVKLFNIENLKKAFIEIIGYEKTVTSVYGEAYGGKTQGMSATYGKDLKFVAFDVKIHDMWLNVPNAEDVVIKLDLEFVHYDLIAATPEAIDAVLANDSVQAIRNGMGPGHKREGVVLRPIFEVRKNNDARIIAKHKNDKFRETKTPRPIDEKRLAVLESAKEIAEEWVTDMRLTHVLDKFSQPWDVSAIGNIIKSMTEDIIREAEGEIIYSKEVQTAIGRKTASLFKKRLKI